MNSTKQNDQRFSQTTQFSKTAFAIATLLMLSACSTSMTKQNETDITETRAHLKTIIDETKGIKPSNFTEQTEPTISIKPLAAEQQDAKAKEWLTKITGITLDPAKNAAIPATAIIRMFRDKGINIVTSLPLDLYSYNGFGVTNVNAETALIVFLGAMGLDFDIDNARHLITIQPLTPQTWIFNIGDRRTSFNAGTDSASSSNSGAAASPNTQSASSQQSMGGNAAPQGGTTSTASSSTTANATTTGTSAANTFSTNDDMWKALSVELAQRLTILVPKTNSPTAAATTTIVPAISNPMQFGQAQTGDIGSLYNTQTVGRFSINPVTGAVTVQAPKYILKTLNEYLTKAQEMYNTTITFEGELVTVTTTNNISEGIDWSAFNNLSNGAFTSVIQNNILGGAVITPAAITGSVVNALTVGNAGIPGAGALLGLTSATHKFAMFNAFLSSIGQLKVKDKPIITTTSGTPVRFRNTVTRRYQQFQQTAASGGVGSAAVATNVIDVPYDTGMTLRLNPRYDAYTGLVRVPFSLERIILNGWEQKANPIVAGTTIQIINTRTPILANTSNAGELLLKNNDLVVVSVMTEDTDDNTDSGVTGLIDGPLKSLAGQGARNKSTTTYYFALRVTVSKKN
jgi:hypothetical protein